MAYCRKCGKKLADNAKFCSICGECQEANKPSSTIVYVHPPTQQQQIVVHKVEKSKGVALLLCFFLGGLGIHQFYLGNTITGVAYLLFSWTCIPVFLSIIDFIIILCMNESYFHQKYDRER